jgi:hypothetical protein
MSLKQSFADQVKAQSDVWNAQIKDFQEQLEQASAKGQGEYMGRRGKRLSLETRAAML